MAVSASDRQPVASDGSSGEDLDGREVRVRAARGAAMFVSRDAVLQALGFLISLALARLLTPADFGITTLGLTIVSAANMIADGGVGASLISRKEPPSRVELGALSGFQLCLTVPISAIAVPIGFAIGGDGPATAIILLTLPLYALRTPPLLLLDRRLQFGPKIIIEVAELVSYGVTAIVLAVVGVGVWAMPIALVVRTLAGTLLAYVVSPIKWARPSLRFDLVKPLLAFGVRFQGTSLVQLVRDLASAALVGAIGGFTDLGYYGFCTRLLAVPQSAATSIGSVTFSAFSRLIGNDEDVGPLVKRATATSVMLTGLMLAPAVAASPAMLPLIFGDRWSGASAMLPGLALTLLVSAPIGWIVTNYLYAKGDATTPFRMSGIVNSILTVAAVAVLGVSFGPAGIGLGRAVGPLVANPLVVARARRGGGPNLWRVILGPAASAIAAGAFGWWLCGLFHNLLLATIVTVTATLCVELILLALTDRDGLVSCYSTIRRFAQMLIPERQTRERSHRRPTALLTDTERDAAFASEFDTPALATAGDGRALVEETNGASGMTLPVVLTTQRRFVLHEPPSRGGSGTVIVDVKPRPRMILRKLARSFNTSNHGLPLRAALGDEAGQASAGGPPSGEGLRAPSARKEAPAARVTSARRD